MKFFIALLAVGTLALSGAIAAPLPANVKAEISSKLANVDPTDSKAVNKAILAIIAAYPSLAAEITGAAVQALSASLSSNQGAANAVIPSLVAEVTKTYPAQAPAVVAAAISNLPAQTANTVGASVVSASVEAAASTETKVAIINSAIGAAQGNTALVASINSIAAQNGITADATGTFVANTEGADDSGATAPLQNQAVPPPTSSGGSGVASGGQPNPAS